MKSFLKLLKKSPALSILYLAFIIYYVLNALLASVDKATLNKYHISVLNARLLGLAVEIPYVIIWVIALVGYLRLRSYAEAIKSEKDGEAFMRMSHGLLLVVVWLPLSAVINTAFTRLYTSHANLTANLVRLNNYIELVFLFAGFYLIYSGSIKLLSFISRLQLTVSLPVVTLYLVFSSAYTFLVLHDPARLLPTEGIKTATYYSKDWLILISIIMPRLIYWFLGIQAAYNIYLYERKVKGKIYKDGLHTLALGLLGIIITTIILRCLQSISVTLTKFNLETLLLLIYVLLIIMCVAYAYLAKGSKKLLKLEEV